MDLKELKEEYDRRVEDLARFRRFVCDQVVELLNSNDVSLGVPLEGRVKEWGSIVEKSKRKDVELKSVIEFQDLVGIRAIFLFTRDLQRALAAVEKTFVVVSREDTVTRLGETGFGYQSVHLIIKTPDEWHGLPALKGCDDLVAELQARTMAQHIWAAASHKLQYKQEQSVPGTLRRSIHRVSALLELADLEFERVLVERDAYVTSDAVKSVDEPLNVDSLMQVLDDLLPAKNKDVEEQYSALLAELLHVGVNTVASLRNLIEKRRPDWEAEEARYMNDEENEQEDPERFARGVFFTHAGLTRAAARFEFGKDWNKPFLIVSED